MARAVPRQAYERDRVISGIAHMFGMTGLIMEIPDRAMQVDTLEKLAECGVNLDLINVTPRRLYAILPTRAYESSGRELLDTLGLKFQATHGCAKISIVGAGMRGTPGVMAQVLSCLHQAGVTVIHSTDSNITISILVKEEDVPKAVAALHDQFLSEPVG